jgi:hypothetical protein
VKQLQQEGARTPKSIKLLIVLPLKKISNIVTLYHNNETYVRSRTSTQVQIPSWNDLLWKLDKGEYLESTPQSDLQLQEVDDEIFPTIKRLMLHSIATRASALPCLELMEWVIIHTKAQE